MQLAIKIGKNKGQQERGVLNCPTIKHWRCVMDISQDTKLIPLTQGKFAIVDAEDYDHLMQWKWHITNGYAKTYINSEPIAMHRLLMQATKGQIVDHINRKKLDNTKKNLRLVSASQKCINQGKSFIRPSVSRYKGITFNAKEQAWKVQAAKEYERYYGGTFRNEKDAAIAYDELAIKLYGVFAVTNQSLGLLEGNESYERRQFSSNFIGIYWNKKKSKWVARISVNKKKIYLGSFNDEKVAAKAYDEAVIRYWGENAKTNKIMGLL